jgi:hypothetical protein
MGLMAKSIIVMLNIRNEAKHETNSSGKTTVMVDTGKAPVD